MIVIFVVSKIFLGGLGCKGNAANVFLIPEGLHHPPTPPPRPLPPAPSPGILYSQCSMLCLDSWHCLPEPASLLGPTVISNEKSLDQWNFAFDLVYMHKNVVRQHFPCSRERKDGKEDNSLEKNFPHLYCTKNNSRLIEM